MNVLLVSEDKIKTISNLDDNTAGKYILPAILVAQDQALEETIGTALLEQLQMLVYSRKIDNFTDYKTLLDKYIQPFLIYSVLANICPILAFKLTNSGVIRTEDEKVYNLSVNEVGAVEDRYQHIADMYKGRLQRYLCKNYDKFPELGECGIVRKNLSASDSSPIFLGGARGKRI